MQDFVQVDANGLSHRVAVAGPETGPLVMLVHGFPESWYSWRHQMAPLAEAGYRVAAPDVRGYGGTDKPHAIAAYGIEPITRDMAALAGALSPNAPVVIVGHDHGAPIAWTSALTHPDRFRAVCGLSVPYTLPGPVPGVELLRQIYTQQGKFFYYIYFQDEGVAEAELEADPRRSIKAFYYYASAEGMTGGLLPANKLHGAPLFKGMPDPTPDMAWFSDEDLDYYASEFARSGFRGPLNRYRNGHADHAFMSSLKDPVIHQPSLFIAGDKDPVLAFVEVDTVALMAPALSNLQGTHLLPGCGHWTQQERPDAVNRILLDWLGALES
ncbi:MAG: alpha/beta hydrolase [Pseudomonadota bacterium]